MSALPPTADIAERNSNVCFGPKADIGASIESPHRRQQARQARAAGSSLPSWLLPHAEQNKRFKSFVRLTRNVPMMSPTQLPADSQITDRSSRRRPASRRFRRYLVAICVGVAGTLAWQSYGEATKQIIAKGAPELGWSPEAKQMIATSIQWLGWTKPPAGPENIAPETVANISKQPAAVAESQSTPTTLSWGTVSLNDSSHLLPKSGKSRAQIREQIRHSTR